MHITGTRLAQMPASSTMLLLAACGGGADGVACIECAVDGAAFQTCQSPLQLPLKRSDGPYQALGAGPHRIRLRSVAADGSVGDTAQFDRRIASIFDKSSPDFTAHRLVVGAVLPLSTSEQVQGACIDLGRNRNGSQDR